MARCLRRHLAGIARGRVAWSLARMTTTRRSWDDAAHATRLTLWILITRVHVLDRVALHRAVVNTTLESTAALSTTGRWLRVVAWPESCFVTSDAGHRYLDFALWVRQFFYLHDFHRNIPRADRLEVLILGNHFDRIMTFGLARMHTLRGVISQRTHLLAGWTIPVVTVVGIRMVTFGMYATR